jgi:hypothetical protein
MAVQLIRLFGATSQEATNKTRTATQWKTTLNKILSELDEYLDAAAHICLEDEDFWPGYVEGITRVTLALLGDYPDHQRRRAGRKRKITTSCSDADRFATHNPLIKR